jgi:hypothetical protein
MTNEELEKQIKSLQETLEIQLEIKRQMFEENKKLQIHNEEAQSLIGLLEMENKRLQKIVIERTMDEVPCKVCGYKGPGYYHPETHPCATIWHEFQEAL